jgi:hypothetical protein
MMMTKLHEELVGTPVMYQSRLQRMAVILPLIYPGRYLCQIELSPPDD